MFNSVMMKKIKNKAFFIINFAKLEKIPKSGGRMLKIDTPVATVRVCNYSSWEIIWQSGSRTLTVHVLEPGNFISGTNF